jgi:hypothetical protein
VEAVAPTLFQWDYALWRGPVFANVPRKGTVCEDPSVAAEPVEVRRAEDGDRRHMALLFAAVAGERDGIAAEPPIDVEERAASWDLDRTFVAHVGARSSESFHIRRANGELWDLIDMGLLL